MPKQLRVLCVLPEVPLPADSGGKHAMLNHMNILRSTCDCHFLILDADGNRRDQAEHLSDMGFNIEYFARTTPKYSNGLRGKISAVSSLLFSKLPRTCSSRISKPLECRLTSLAKSGLFDIIVFEHISSCHFASALPKSSTLPFVYYSQNVEAKSSYDKYLSCRSLGLRTALYLDYLKTRRFEKSILKLAHGVISISDADIEYLSSSSAAKKIHFVAEAFPVPPITWDFNNTKPQLLFVGSPSHAPNRDAIEWIIECFSPELLKFSSVIEIHFVGSKASDFPSYTIPSNIFFHGRVSSERLTELYLSSRLALSPIELGSGVKIKILEALSFGIPLACSHASLEGIPFANRLLIAAAIDRTSPHISAQEIVRIINSEDVLMQSTCNRSIIQSEFDKQASTYYKLLSMIASSKENHSSR